MSVQMKCKCGARLSAPRSLVGKRAKCQGCGFSFTVPDGKPTPATEDSMDAEGASVSDTSDHDAADWLSHHVGGQRPGSDFGEEEFASATPEAQCPDCDQSMPNDGVVCMHCGYHRHLQRRLESLDTNNVDAVRRKVWTILIPTSLCSLGR